MRILVTGDSLIARHEQLDQPMINYCLQQQLTRLEIVNTAISGSNSQDLLQNWKTFFPNNEFSAVFLLIGTNDLALHKQIPLKKFQTNLLQIIKRLKHIYPTANLCLITPPAVDESKQKWRNNQLIAQYTEIMLQTATQNLIKSINLQAAMLAGGSFPAITKGILNDGLHFGLAGYQLLANLIKQQLLTTSSSLSVKITSYHPQTTNDFSLLLAADPDLKQITRYVANGSCFAAKNQQNQLVGLIILSKLTKNQAEILNLTVIPSQRRRGIGRQLIKHAIGWAAEHQLQQLFLGTGSTSYSALALYQRCGFRLDAIQTNYFIEHYQQPIWENGCWLKDRLWLVYDLK
ncbi:GNAT family N-acetyltransferase [Liquorilactobacillus sicerae]|uniref:GNAT family N-acetyltransferase n=1 Tax=Liquorilactobacillus sicerae TaxID=1416943 RepID=UPI002480412C|nr:GNAT family N-acetyltransferase [Liquorilactobacillus sicerae]